MTPSDAVLVKKRATKLDQYPVNFLSLPEICVLLGIESREQIIEAIRLNYEVTPEFISGIWKLLESNEHHGLGSTQVKVLEDLAQAFSHFNGKYPVEFSSEYESAARSKVVQFKGDDELYFNLSNCAQTEPWSFDISITKVNRLIDEVVRQITRASIQTLSKVLSERHNIEPLLAGRIAHEFVIRNLEPPSDSLSIRMDYFLDALAIPKLEYVWNRMQHSENPRFVSDLERWANGNKANTGRLLDLMRKSIRADRVKADVQNEYDLKKIEAVYRKVHDIYFLQKKVILRMIEVIRTMVETPASAAPKG